MNVVKFSNFAFANVTNCWANINSLAYWPKDLTPLFIGTDLSY